LQNERYAVSTESGSDRVAILAISILAIGGDPVATALGTDCITFVLQIKTLSTRHTDGHE